MTKTATKTVDRTLSLVIDREARLAARKRVVGLWKGKVKELIRENRKLRKEWDRPVKKIGW